MQDKNIKVAIYCRVASADQLSLDSQRERLISYAIENGFEEDTLKVYADNGYSGLNFTRPAFAEMECDIDAGVIGAVIVRNESRISRSAIDTLMWIERLRRKKQIALLSADATF